MVRKANIWRKKKEELKAKLRGYAKNRYHNHVVYVKS